MTKDTTNLKALYQTPSAHELFFEKNILDRAATERIVKKGLEKTDDGELYLEFTQSESFVFEDGCIKTSSFDISKGFGLRSVVQDRQGYAHSADVSETALEKACQTVQAVRQGYEGIKNIFPKKTNHSFYTKRNPINLVDFDKKIRLLQEINRYARAKNSSIEQVTISLRGKWQAIGIMRPDGYWAEDIRPIAMLSINIVTKKGDRLEYGCCRKGLRGTYDSFLEEGNWKSYVDEALRKSLLNQEAIAAPAGVMPVVLGPGEPGTLLHEAIGHGLEGDFNRKNLSVFSNRIGEKVAADCVSVVDDGTLQDKWGTLNIDDEGTPTQRNVLIENGILKGYMQDRMNARLMGQMPTGNCRRESYAHLPMPRMTSTFMLGGKHDPEKIISSVNRGIYAVDFSGGQVDIVNGNFVFSTTEAYMIENGQITTPIKGATLVGNGPDIMTKVKMVGNNLELDTGSGHCGKNGQSVPVNVGQPTVLIDSMTVGGTAS